MLRLAHRIRWLLLAIAALTVAGCDPQSLIPAPPAPSESVAAPTQGALPAERPAASERPTHATASLRTTRFSRADQLFTIDVPEGWSHTDRSDPQLALDVFSDPTTGGLLAVAVSEEPEPLPDAAVGQRLMAFVDSFAGERDFVRDAPQPGATGATIGWRYAAAAEDGGAQFTAISSLHRAARWVAVVTIALPTTSAAGWRAAIAAIDASFALNPAAAFAPPRQRQVEYRFDGAADGWAQQEDEQVAAAARDGVYSVTLKQPDSYYISAPEGERHGELMVSADVLPARDARAGVVLRLNTYGDGTRSFYACWIDAADSYGCLVSVNDSWLTLVEPGHTDALRPGQANRVELAARGGDFALRINGRVVATFSDARLSDGTAGVYLENFAAPSGATFDHVVVSAP